MRRLLALLMLALAAGILFAPTASANHVADGGVDQPWTNDMNQESYWETLWGMDCSKFENHSGFIPEQYDAAVIKDGNYVRVYASVGGAFTALGAVNPANGQHFAAPHSWVMKCSGTTTTTQDTTTTTTPTTTSSSTTVPEETTTTQTEETTTTTPAPTTTAPTSSLPLTAIWDASAVCEILTVPEFPEGIVQVNVFLQDPQFGEIEVDPFLTPGDKNASTGEGATWILVPVVVNGYTAVPDQIELTTSRCEAPTTTFSPTSVPDEPVLPFTGMDSNLLAGLGLSALALGALMIFFGRREEV